MTRISIVNLVNKPAETTHFTHGAAKTRSVLKQLLNNKKSFVIVGSNEKMPGGFADFNKHVKLKRKRMPRHTLITRQKLKSIL